MTITSQGQKNVSDPKTSEQFVNSSPPRQQFTREGNVLDFWIVFLLYLFLEVLVVDCYYLVSLFLQNLTLALLNFITEET